MLLENNPYPQDVRVRHEAESLQRAGYRVLVVAPRLDGQPREETLNGVRVRRFRAIFGTTTSTLLAEYAIAHVALFREALRSFRRGTRVVHLHNPPDTLFPIAALARVLGCKVVFDHHDLFPELVEATGRGRAWKTLASLSERLSFRTASLVVSTNESYAEIARTRGAKAASRVVVVRNGPLQRTVVHAPEVREGSLLDPVIVYVGIIAEQDGVAALGEVMVRLRDAHGLTGARLVVVGDGPARPALDAKIAAAHLSDVVTVTGMVPPALVADHIRSADVCVDPAQRTALNEASTMTKIAEYLAGGKPVVAYALRETSRTLAGSGLLVEPDSPQALADAIARVARDQSLRAQLATRAHRRASDLVWERSESELLGAYRQLLGYPGA
jgi:glycosyltransferase involved in cell wall biosynthesis